MANGKILYKDIYEQKGLYLYVLYAIAYGISQQSFIGAYLLELAFGFAFACAVYRLLILYIRKDAALVLTPVLLFLSYTPQSFSQGGSAEEFVQPLMAWALWFLLSGVKKRNASMLLRHYALAGVFAAFAFWIKFTMCGFFFAFILVAFLFELRNKNVRRAFTGAGVFAGGMVWRPAVLGGASTAGAAPPRFPRRLWSAAKCPRRPCSPPKLRDVERVAEGED